MLKKFKGLRKVVKLLTSNQYYMNIYVKYIGSRNLEPADQGSAVG